MTIPQPEKTNVQKVLVLDGDLTNIRSEEIKAVFADALRDAQEVSVTFGEIAALDLSCLQLLCSAHRSAVRLHKRMRFEGMVPPILTETARFAGFLHLKGCEVDGGRTCLWATITGAHHG